MNTAITTPLALCFVLSDKTGLPRFELRSNLAMTRFKFQAAHFVIASLTKVRRSNLLKLFLTSISEVKNNFRVAYQI
ncbi:MAG: hypothetical protein J6W29_05010 [Neisseriaceae bacterium]|nr:hypothetical protein [Neisseriaceae bacterium]